MQEDEVAVDDGRWRRVAVFRMDRNITRQPEHFDIGHGPSCLDVDGNRPQGAAAIGRRREPG
jgi:hypothetical protein